MGQVKQLFYTILNFLHPSFFVRLGIPFLSQLPSSQFLCSTWNPVSSPRPTRVEGRRAQGLSRSAVAPPWPHAPSFPGRALTAPSTAARWLWSGRRSEGSLPSGADHRATTLYSVGP